MIMDVFRLSAIRLRCARGQTMTEYALLLAAVALTGYGLAATVGYNFVDDAIDDVFSRVLALFH
jgi:Flp pilus assembly pilin Flp